ncbi:UNVERIFIED_ORG: hypothetical protein J2X79_002536 [Arthrobacter globiformis]|nr:hypothetical protein [Arthrobacter globiformis]
MKTPQHGPYVQMRDEVEPREDFLVRVSRAATLAGLFLVSLLVVRVGGAITIGDLLLMASAGLLAVVPKPPLATLKAPSVSRIVITLLIFVGGLIATSVSPAPADSLQVLFRILYVAVILPWQIRRLFPTPRGLSLATTAFAMGAALCGFGSVLQNRLGPSIIPGAEVTIAGRYSGFTAHVSDAGGITALAVAAGVAGLGLGASRMTKFLSVGFIAGGLIGLILSGSVSGMASAGAGTVAVMLLRGVSVGKLFLIGGAGGGAFYFASGVLSGTQNALTPLERFYQAVGLTPSAASSLNTTASRLETDRLGWESFLANPWTGVGLDTQSSIVDHLYNLSVHNFILGAMHQGGWIFALGILLAALSLLLPGLRLASGDSLRVRATAMAVAAVTFAVTAPSFYNRYFWVPLALLAAYHSLPTKVPEPENNTKGDGSVKL